MNGRVRADLEMQRRAEIAPAKLAYRVHEAADALGIGVSTLWRRIAEKKIATKKEGGNTLILRSELERYLNDLPDGGSEFSVEGGA